MHAASFRLSEFSETSPFDTDDDDELERLEVPSNDGQGSELLSSASKYANDPVLDEAFDFINYSTIKRSLCERAAGVQFDAINFITDSKELLDDSVESLVNKSSLMAHSLKCGASNFMIDALDGLRHCCTFATETTTAVAHVPRRIFQGAIQGLTEAFVGGMRAGLWNQFQDVNIQRVTEQFVGSIQAGLGNQFQGVNGQIVDNINYLYTEAIQNNIAKLTGIISAGTASFTIIRNGIPVCFTYLQHRLLNPKPKLIIESSKKSWAQLVTSMVLKKLQLPFDMVFSPALRQQLNEIINITKMINLKITSGKSNVKYRNLMLYGPPGTGKTMFAQELAKRSGLEYAFMSGSSFSKFKDGAGIEALDELFAWAKHSKGLLIFIDEADTFLSNREHMDPQSKSYQLLNNFLNYTGERSDKFMLVFATNHKDVLDSAMYRRIDDLIEMPLPSKEQRISALNLYKNKILLDAHHNDSFFIDSVHQYLNDEVIDSIAEKIQGFSYGDIQGIINSLQTDSDILTPAVLDQQLIDKVVNRAVTKHIAFTQKQPLGVAHN